MENNDDKDDYMNDTDGHYDGDGHRHLHAGDDSVWLLLVQASQ